MIYVSYHYHNLNESIQILYSLKLISYDVWWDRYNINLDDNWLLEKEAIITQADCAVILLSDAYLKSLISLNELKLIDNNNIPKIGIILNNFDLTTIDDIANFTDVIDLRKIQSEDQLQTILRLNFEQLGLAQHNKVLSERLQYSHVLIANLEKKLKSLSKSSSINDAIVRGYNQHLVIYGSFELIIEQEVLVIEDLLSLMKIQPYLLLKSTSSQEVSTLLYLLCLWSVHGYKQNVEAILPIYLHPSEIDESQSVETWVRDVWLLEHDYLAWLDDKPVRFFLEFEDIHNEKASVILNKIATYCMQSDNRSYIIASSSIDISELDKSSIVVVQSRPLSLQQVKKINSYFDENLRGIDTNNTYTFDDITLISDYASQTDDVIDLQQLPKHLVQLVLFNRWQKLFGLVELPISFDELFNALSYLAWHTTLNDIDAITKQDVLNLLGDSTLLEIGIELGVLRDGTTLVRFASNLVKSNLLAYILLTDGIYKHLRKPTFDHRHQRIITKWDQPLLACFNIIEPEQYDELVELVDDIDPFLAIEFAVQDKQLLEKYLCQLIHKSLDIQRKNPTAEQAVVSLLCKIPQHFAVATCLIQSIRVQQHIEQIKLQNILQQIPYTIPETILQDVHDLDRDFMDARTELLLHGSNDDWAIYLSCMVSHSNPRIQRNAIFLAGGLDDRAVLPSLYILIGVGSQSIVKDAIQAILEIQSSDVALPYIVQSLQDQHLKLDIVAYLLTELGRNVSSSIVQYLLNDNMPDLRNFCYELVRHNEQDIQFVVMQELNLSVSDEPNVEENEILEERMSKLGTLLRQRLGQLSDKASLDAVVNEISEKMNNAQASEQQTPRTNTLRKRQGSNSATSSQSQNHYVANLPETIMDLLNSEDWLERYRGVQQLADYNNRDVFELIRKIALEDSDPQVRVSALEILNSGYAKDDTVDIFMACLIDEEYLVVDAATDYFKRQKRVDTRQIIALLDHANTSTVVAAIDILSVHQDTIAIASLQHLQNDNRKAWLDDQTVAQRALDLLEQLKQSQRMQQDANLPNAVVTSDKSSRARTHRTDLPANEKYNPEQKIRLTLIALKKDDWELSQKAARYLRKLAEQLAHTTDLTIIKLLEDNLQDENWVVRWAVVEALAWIKAPTSEDKIITLLHDENWMVQVAAVRSLVELGAYDKAPAIVPLLNHVNTAVAETAAEGLGTLKNPDVFVDLKNGLSSSDEFVRLATIQAMQHISPKRTRNDLFALLGDSYSHIRWFAIKELSANPPIEALKIFTRLLLDESGAVWEKYNISDYALIALENLNTTESRAIVKEWHARQSEKDN